LSSIVRALVLAHLSATALLLLVFLAVVLWQRVADALHRQAAPAVPYPSDAERSATPAPPVARVDAVVVTPAPADDDASVPAGAQPGRELQPS
jgi:hypothetical protein